jgi:hypothetical protein
MKERGMRTRIAAILGSALLAAAIPEPALAQSEPRTLTVTPTAAWGHAETGMILPPRVGRLVRQKIEDNTQNEFDVVTTFVDRDTGVIALVYLYRTMTPNVPLWFDRAVATVMLPQTGAAFPTITAFTRPGASAASGLRAAMTDNVAGMRSTALAIAPLGSSFLIKIRMGSSQLDPAQLNERLTAFIAGLRWPAESGAATVAVPVEPCPEPLRLREARIVRTDGANVLMDAVIGSMPPEQRVEGPPPVFCREPGATVAHGVYRANRSTRSYLIALADAGTLITVGPALDLSELMGNGGSRRYAVSLLRYNSSAAYPSFNRLPPPEQALALVRTGSSALSVTVGGEPERR